MISFCDRLKQLGEHKGREFAKGRIGFVFDELLRQKSDACTKQNLHLLWFVLGTVFKKANKTCLRITRHIDAQTLKTLQKDKLALHDLELELAQVLKDGKVSVKISRRVRRLEFLLAGKKKLMVAEAMKVDLLYGLLLPRNRPYSQRSKKDQLRRHRAGVQVESLVGPSLWDWGETK